MSEIQDFVVLSITRETARLTQTGFGTPLLMGPHYYLPETTKVTTYTDPADMITDGFLTTDDLYVAALKLMGQELSPEQFKVGRKNDDVNSKATLAFTGTASAGTFTVTVGIADATPIETGAIAWTGGDDSVNIKAAIEALAGITEVTVAGSYVAGYTVEFTGVDAAADFRVTAIDISSLTGITAATVTMNQYGSATETWAVGYNAIEAEDDDFYFLIPMLDAVGDQTDMEALAAIIETKVKMMALVSNDPVIITAPTTDVAGVLDGLDYDRTFTLYSGTASGFPQSAWVGGQAPKNPGSITWKFKPLTGVTADTLTTTQLGYAQGKNCNTYEAVAGISMISSDATVASGEYIDIIRGTDWLQTRMQEAVFSALANSDKIPITDRGIGVIGAIVEYWLTQAVDAELLAEGSTTVILPRASSITVADRGDRYLRTITFTGTYAGAVHKVGITGTIGV